MASAPPNPSLTDILDEQIVCSESLIGILESERNALVSSDVEALETVCKTKAAAAQRLFQLGEQMKIFVAPGLKGAEVEAQLARHPNGSTLVEQWRHLTALATRCSEANRANGAMVEAREVQVRGALAAMQPEAPAVYGRSGINKPSLPGRVFSRA